MSTSIDQAVRAAGILFETGHKVARAVQDAGGTDADLRRLQDSKNGLSRRVGTLIANANTTVVRAGSQNDEIYAIHIDYKPLPSFSEPPLKIVTGVFDASQRHVYEHPMRRKRTERQPRSRLLLLKGFEVDITCRQAYQWAVTHQWKVGMVEEGWALARALPIVLHGKRTIMLGTRAQQNEECGQVYYCPVIDGSGSDLELTAVEYDEVRPKPYPAESYHLFARDIT